MTDPPRYKAFVSSTCLDLKRHRIHVIKALRQVGFVVDLMEDWTAEVRFAAQGSSEQVVWAPVL